MSQKKSELGPHRTEVDLATPETARYWCDRFECTPAELHKAVNIVGPSAIAVERILEIEKQFQPMRGTPDWMRVQSS